MILVHFIGDRFCSMQYYIYAIDLHWTTLYDVYYSRKYGIIPPSNIIDVDFINIYQPIHHWNDYPLEEMWTAETGVSSLYYTYSILDPRYFYSFPLSNHNDLCSFHRRQILLDVILHKYSRSALENSVRRVLFKKMWNHSSFIYNKCRPY